MEDVIRRIALFMKWFWEQALMNPERAVEWGERLMADPNQKRLRPLYEASIGTFPFVPKGNDTWGVLKGNVLWACKRRAEGDVFLLGDHVVGVYKDMTYEVFENVVIVCFMGERMRQRGMFTFDPADGMWHYSTINDHHTVVAVDGRNVVFHNWHSGELFEVSILGYTRPILDGKLFEGAKGGEGWIVAWKRDGDTGQCITVYLVAGQHVEHIVLDATHGNPKVFPRFDRDGKFVNACVTVEAMCGLDADGWHHGAQLSVLLHAPMEVFERAMVVDGHTWEWRRNVGQQFGGDVEVRGKAHSRSNGRVTALEVKNGMVCMLKSIVMGYTVFTVCTPDGTVCHELGGIQEPTDLDPLAQWPFLRLHNGEYCRVRIEGNVVTVDSVMMPGPARTHRKGEYLFVTGEAMSSGEWMTVAYHESVRGEDGQSMSWFASSTTRKPVELASVVVPCLGEMIVAMRRSDKWVTVHDVHGNQMALDYHEVRDIAVEDGFITFVGRRDQSVVRVRVPV